MGNSAKKQRNSEMFEPDILGEIKESIDADYQRRQNQRPAILLPLREDDNLRQQREIWEHAIREVRHNLIGEKFAYVQVVIKNPGMPNDVKRITFDEITSECDVMYPITVYSLKEMFEECDKPCDKVHCDSRVCRLSYLFSCSVRRKTPLFVERRDGYHVLDLIVSIINEVQGPMVTSVFDKSSGPNHRHPIRQSLCFVLSEAWLYYESEIAQPKPPSASELVRMQQNIAALEDKLGFALEALERLEKKG